MRFCSLLLLVALCCAGEESLKPPRPPTDWNEKENLPPEPDPVEVLREKLRIERLQREDAEEVVRQKLKDEKAAVKRLAELRQKFDEFIKGLDARGLRYAHAGDYFFDATAWNRIPFPEKQSIMGTLYAFHRELNYQAAFKIKEIKHGAVLAVCDDAGKILINW